MVVVKCDIFSCITVIVMGLLSHIKYCVLIILLLSPTPIDDNVIVILLCLYIWSPCEISVYLLSVFI